MRIYIPIKSKSTYMEVSTLCPHFSAVSKNVDLDIVGHHKTRINYSICGIGDGRLMFTEWCGSRLMSAGWVIQPTNLDAIYFLIDNTKMAIGHGHKAMHDK